MLTYDLSQRGELSLYDYLYRCIKQDILAGHIRAGERLPSKRQLAAHLKISVITVEGAYAQLLTEGYIRSQEKSGYFAYTAKTLLRRSFCCLYRFYRKVQTNQTHYKKNYYKDSYNHIRVFKDFHF